MYVNPDNVTTTNEDVCILFGGKQKPQMIETLIIDSKMPIESLDIIVSFIMKTGFEELLKIIENVPKVRIVTSTYMGISDFNSINQLSKLKNVEIKISTFNERLHAKSYIFHKFEKIIVYVGSSNISRPALTDGIEWNVRLDSTHYNDLVQLAVKEFERFWANDKLLLYDPTDERLIDTLQKTLRKSNQIVEEAFIVIVTPKPEDEPIERLCHLRALQNLQVARQNGKWNNLIVAATGVGKTRIAALDFQRFYDNCKIYGKKCNLLFVAHRIEIVKHACRTFNSVTGLNTFIYKDIEDFRKRPDPVYCFITIEKLNRIYSKFEPDRFDYIVIDETHHSVASSYHTIYNYFKPRIRLGLTATPHRLDGKDITELYDHEVVSEISLAEAISENYVVPFHYYAVDTDIRVMSTPRNRLDSEIVEAYKSIDVAYIAKTIVEHTSNELPLKCLIYCCSEEHAQFLYSEFNKLEYNDFNYKGKCAVVTSKSSKDREVAPKKLAEGKINIIFCIDIFNEGIDIPEVNTVVFLRPTESLTVFIQQLGRGLRTSVGKKYLTAIDFVGMFNKNYDIYIRKLEYIMDSPRIRRKIEYENYTLPSNCKISISSKSWKTILEYLDRMASKQDIETTYVRFRDESEYGSLEEFLEYADLDISTYYALFKTPFYSISKKIKNDLDFFKPRNDTSCQKFLGLFCYRISRIDSKSFAKVILDLLDLKTPLVGLSSVQKKYAEMLYYALPNERTWQGDIVTFVEELRKMPDLCQEISSILRMNLPKMKEEIDLDLGFECNLKVHCSYFLEQIYANLDPKPLSQNNIKQKGWNYIQDKNIATLMVNWTKSASSTNYVDILRERNQILEWESERSTTRSQFQDVLNKLNDGGHIIFIARESEDYHGIDRAVEPFVFLGEIRCNELKNESQPVKVNWKLDIPVPETIRCFENNEISRIEEVL